MSIHFLSQVWDDHSIKSRSDLLVLLAISDYARNDGKAWPSIDSLAKKARCSHRAIQDSVSRLISQKKLTVEYGEGPSGTNVYTVIIGGVQDLRGADSRTEIRRKIRRVAAPNPSGTVSNGQEPVCTRILKTDRPMVGMEVIDRVKSWLVALYNKRNTICWPGGEEAMICDVCRRPEVVQEMEELSCYRKQNGKFFPKSSQRLLEAWDKTLDEARQPRRANDGAIVQEDSRFDKYLK